MKTTGYIDEFGKYVRGEDKAMPDDVNIMHKDYSHSYERKVYAREIIQPRVNGKPNPEFINAYPKYSKKYFDQDTIDKTLRELP
jgi:hypothetical protein